MIAIIGELRHFWQDSPSHLNSTLSLSLQHTTAQQCNAIKCRLPKYKNTVRCTALLPIRLTTTLGTWQTISPQICSIGHLPLQITIVRTKQIYVSQCLDKYSTPRIISWIHALRIQPSWTHALWNGYIAVMNYEYIGLGFTSISLKVPRGRGFFSSSLYVVYMYQQRKLFAERV